MGDPKKVRNNESQEPYLAVKTTSFFDKRNYPKNQHNKNFPREYQDMIAS